MVAAIGMAASALLPFLPTIGKAVLGWLPGNATSVITGAIGAVTKGIEISKPILNTLSNIAGMTGGIEGPGQAATSPDITLAEMHAALAELATPGVYEDALAKARAEQP